MTASILLTHTSINSGSPTKILGNAVVVGGNHNVIATPDENPTGPVEAYIGSYENLKYVISGVHFTGVADTFLYTDLLKVYKSNTAALLQINYDDGIALPNLSESTSGIAVALKSFSFTLDTKDSKDAYRPKATLTFIETT